MEGEDGRADSTVEKVMEEEEKKKTTTMELDLKLLTCCLQSLNVESNYNYIGIRRLLLSRKSQSGSNHQKNVIIDDNASHLFQHLHTFAYFRETLVKEVGRRSFSRTCCGREEQGREELLQGVGDGSREVKIYDGLYR